jgi:hypothetical protein
MRRGCLAAPARIASRATSTISKEWTAARGGFDVRDRLTGGLGRDHAIISPNDITTKIEAVETR